jgi:hypothetical protein
LALALRIAGAVPHVVIQWLTLTAFVLPGVALMARPLGFPFSGTSSKPRVVAFFEKGGFGGGTVLPLRREWVVRSFYLHGLATGALSVGLLSGVFGWPPAIVWLQFALIIPPYAGLLAAEAAGERWLMTLCLVALVFTWPADIGGALLAASDLHQVATIGPPTDWFAFVPRLFFACVGGVPPLVYLFPRKRVARRPYPPPR